MQKRFGSSAIPAGRAPLSPTASRRAWTIALLLVAALFGAVAGYDVRIAVLLAMLGTILVATWMRPALIVGLLILSIFMEVVSLGGVTVSRLVAPVALIVVAVEFVRGRARLTLSLPLAWTVGYCLWAFASSLWTVSAEGTTELLLSLAIAVVYMLCVATLVSDEPALRRLLILLAAVSAAAGLYTLAAFGGIVSSETNGGRPAGGVGDPNFFACVQLVVLPLVLAVAGQTQRVWLRFGIYLGALVVIASILSTLSRGGLIALLVILAITPFLPAKALIGTRRQKVAMMLIIVVGVSALMMRPAFRDEVTGRAATIVAPAAVEPTGSSNGSGRTEAWKAALFAASERPLTGIGFGAFRDHFNELILIAPGVDLTKIAPHPDGLEPHSAHIGTLAELGIPGLALLWGLLIATAVSLRRTARRARAAGALFVGRVANALVLSTLAWAISSMFISTETSRPIWIVIGLALALPRLLERPAARPPAPS
ncbi:MAG TPA: O-antigen ligase family protein [Solirubrobacteraceae bacterium]|nr:O-antigen ligase family protein [Solirubrobacteraceae bacterium]